MDYMNEISKLRNINASMAMVNEEFLGCLQPLKQTEADVYEAGVGCYGDFKDTLTKMLQSLNVVANMTESMFPIGLVSELTIVNALSECYSQHRELNDAFAKMATRLDNVVQQRTGKPMLH